MRSNFASRLRIAPIVAVLSITAMAQSPTPAATGPAPSALLSAKTAFVSNVGTEMSLFPQPFSGDSNRIYAQLYQAVKSSGQFAIVDDPSDADLVLELHLMPDPGAGFTKQNIGLFRLIVYDRKTHYVLWTATQPIGIAVLQKSWDRNFDEALDAVVSQFLQIAGKRAPKAP